VLVNDAPHLLAGKRSPFVFVTWVIATSFVRGVIAFRDRVDVVVGAGMRIRHRNSAYGDPQALVLVFHAALLLG